MSIEVPSSAHPPGVPQFHGEHLPQGEQDAAHYLNVLLAQLGRYEWQFRNALALFDLCRKEVSDLSTKIDINNLPKFPIIEGSGHTLRAWEMMAARDGAMAIYHFGQALTAIARGLGRARRYALRWIIPPVGRRKKAFEHRFPSHDAIRDVVSHQVDFGATMAERETHSIKPPWSRSFGNQTIEVAGSRPIRFADNLYDRVYCVTCRGGVHCYEITAETVKVLSAVREQTYAAFDAAADPEFYRCPKCEGRNLSEVYSRRVYRCVDCDQPVTDEMMLVWRHRRRRCTAARSALIALLRARSQGLARAA